VVPGVPRGYVSDVSGFPNTECGIADLSELGRVANKHCPIEAANLFDPIHWSTRITPTYLETIYDNAVTF
jgi:hypothetical protein